MPDQQGAEDGPFFMTHARQLVPPKNRGFTPAATPWELSDVLACVPHRAQGAPIREHNWVIERTRRAALAQCRDPFLSVSILKPFGKLGGSVLLQIGQV